MDVTRQRLVIASHDIRLTNRGFSLLSLLVLARLAEREGNGCGSVTTEEIEMLPGWSSGTRSSESLASQIRREIKRLEHEGIDVVATPHNARVKGPFRLKIFPARNCSDIQYLQARFTLTKPPLAQTPAELFRWLETAEPVWRVVHSFDKPEVVLAAALQLPVPHVQQDPLIAATAHISRARHLRELRNFQRAKQALELAKRATLSIPLASPLRSYLLASYYLHQGWLDYKSNRREEIEKSILAAWEALDGTAHLRIRGQLLTLQSIVRRMQHRFDEAVRYLKTASEYFFVEGDLYNLFSVYHNLSAILTEQASCETDGERRHALLTDAILFCKKSDEYCRAYHLGQNSNVSAIHLISLYTQLGDAGTAMSYAVRAYEQAIEKENFEEAAIAHAHRIRLLFQKRAFADAEMIQAAFLKLINAEGRLRLRVESGYNQLLCQAQRTHGNYPA